jgi:putative ABC transport system permease protein
VNVGGVWVTWRSWFRAQWLTVVALAVLLALGVAIGFAALAGARRTASAYERVLDAVDAPDVISGHALPPAEAAATAATVAGAAEAYTDVGFTGFIEGFDPTLVPYYIGAYDHAGATDRQLLVAGRYPRADEVDTVLITERAANRAGLALGDTVTVAFFTPTDDVIEEPLRIVGIGRERRMAIGDAALSRDALFFGQAFTREHLDIQVWSRTTFVAEDVGVLTDALVDIGWPVDETRAADHERAQDSVRPIVLSLVAVGAVALLATMLVVHQALTRQHQARRQQRTVLRAVGATRREVRLGDLAATGAVVFPGVVLGVLGAVVLSGLSPLGSVRRIDPDVGVHLDWVVLGPLALVTAAVLVATSLRAAGRQGGTEAVRRVRPARFAGGRPELAVGTNLAVGSTSLVRQAFWTTAVLTISTVTLIVGAVTFINALDRLTDSPERYGFGWDVVARNAYGAVDPDTVVDTFAGDSQVTGIAAGTARNVIVNGRQAVPAMLLTPVTEEFWPTIQEGRAPRDDGEVLMGRSTLDELGVEIGDVVSVAAAGDDGVAGASDDAEVEIVGSAIFAPVELAGLDPARLAVGMTFDFSRYLDLADRSGLPQAAVLRSPDIVYFDLVDGADRQAFVDRHPEGVPDERRVPTEWLLSVAPAEVLESNEALPILWASLVPLTLLVLATVGHAQLTVIRRRRSDYAVLRALGFTRRQVLGTVAWQSTATVLIPILFGIPLGVAAGRVGWEAFAGLIGVDASTPIPVPGVTLVALAAVALTNVVCLVPAAVAARVPPGGALRSE